MDPDDFFLIYLLATFVLSSGAFLLLVRVYPNGHNRRIAQPRTHRKWK